MKKRWIAGLCAALLFLSAQAALADSTYGYAVIDGRNSTKVHMREEPSSDSDSMGLFYTGTEVSLKSDPDARWVYVRIGVEHGYVRSTYLRRGEGREELPKRFKDGVIDATNYARFRRGPSTEYQQLGTIPDGAAVTVMGETDNHWYYIEYKGEDGYVSANLVDLTGSSGQSGSSAPSVPSASQTAPQPVRDLPIGVPGGWTHTSGAGAWSTELRLEESDASFYGYFSDADANVVYESSFSGRFTDLYRADAYTYTMTVSDFAIDGTPGEVVLSNGVYYVTQSPAGIAQGDPFVLYLPGTPVSRLSQEELSWLPYTPGDTLSSYYLCNRSTGRGFVPGSDFK